MAAVARIAAVVVTDMAGRAFNVVVAIQFEILRVIEGGGGPFVLAMALAAIAAELAMQRVFRRLVAGLALLA